MLNLNSMCEYLNIFFIILHCPSWSFFWNLEVVNAFPALQVPGYTIGDHHGDDIRSPVSTHTGNLR